MFYKRILRPFLFLLPPESAHHFVFTLLKFFFFFPFVSSFVQRLFDFRSEKLRRNVVGLDFKNPVGLAAGFDKNALLLNEFSALGFGFIEIGTVTPLPQPGNPKPRMFRLKKDQAIINRMGFNNDGVEVIRERLLKFKKKNILIGGNIGKNKITPNEKAVTDYLICFERLFDVVDYFVVNVSSPNTPGLRELQEKAPLINLLSQLNEKNKLLSKGKLKPVFLKIAPDLTKEQLNDIIEVVTVSKTAGIIATNTTLSREGLLSEKSLIQQAGGLSGKPVADRSTQVISYLKNNSHGQFAIIGVGGIHSASDAIEKIKAGADLIQLYTGFIYEGPSLIKKINKSLI